jgi:hypothetical protein
MPVTGRPPLLVVLNDDDSLIEAMAKMANADTRNIPYVEKLADAKDRLLRRQ